jgi:putative salt-induced outer membrane protein YdiY
MKNQYLFQFIITLVIFASQSFAQEYLPQRDAPNSAGTVKVDQPTLCAKGCVAEIKNPEDWDLSAAFGLNATQGNASSSVYSLNAIAQKTIMSNLFRLEVLGGKGEQEKVTTQEFLKTDLAYKYVFDDRFYIGTSGQALWDKIADVDYRYTLNIPSFGYFLVKDEKTSLSVEAGPSVILEKLSGEENNFVAAHIADRLEWTISKTSKVFQAVEGYLNTDDTGQFLINGEVGIEAAISTNLALVFSVRNRFNSQPAEGREKNDMFYTSALKVRF